MDPKALRAWVDTNWKDAPSRKREYDAGLKAIETARASAEKHKTEMMRRDANLRAKRGKK
jgi:hypothetical protein